MERVSCIDIGTNTALLLIVDIDPKQGTIKPVHHKQAIVRLGQQVDELKIIDREAKERLINCLLEFKKSAMMREQILLLPLAPVRYAMQKTEWRSPANWFVQPA